MSDEVLVRVENVSKRFCRSFKRSLWYGLKDLGNEMGGKRHGGGSGLPKNSDDVLLRPDEFWAVKDVSFELRRGECLGLVGQNGAGKTTLLRMLNGLIKPDSGRMEIKGQIGALIALGAGFNPILTGRENIKINASILGMSSKQIDSAIDEIVEFAEMAEAIDTPVQSYSSGMQVRLGFAIATSLNPDILFLDEVLAVGDIGFQAKCLVRLSRITPQVATIFVSHQPHLMSRICSRGIYLEASRVKMSGPIDEVLSAYISSRNSKIAKTSKQTMPAISPKIDSCSIKLNTNKISKGDDIEIKAFFKSSTKLKASTIIVNLLNLQQEFISKSTLDIDNNEDIENRNLVLTVHNICLADGLYSICFQLLGNNGLETLYYGILPDRIESLSHSFSPSAYQPKCSLRIASI